MTSCWNLILFLRHEDDLAIVGKVLAWSGTALGDLCFQEGEEGFHFVGFFCD